MKDKSGKVERVMKLILTLKDLKMERLLMVERWNYSLVIGSNTFIPGFEDALIGMQVNEEKILI